MRYLPQFLFVIGIGFIYLGIHSRQQQFSPSLLQAQPILKAKEYIKEIVKGNQNKQRSIFKNDSDEVLHRSDSPDVFIDSKKSVLKSVNRAFGCIESQNPCDEFKASNVNDYVQNAIDFIYSMTTLRLNEIKSGNGMISDEDSQVAIRLSQSTFVDLQILGLQFMQVLPQSEEFFDLAIQSAKMATEDDVLEESLAVIRGYEKNSVRNEKLTEALMIQIRMGLRDTSAQLAIRQLYQMINSENYSTLERLSQDLKPFPRRHQALQSALDEYRENQPILN